MAEIKPYLDAIMEAEYGEQVRGSIHDAIKAINDEVQEGGGGGISEITDGTPTDIDGILEGKNGTLQKMSSYPILHTIDLPYPMDSNFRKILTYILPLDTSKDSYQICSMLTLLSKSQNSSLPVILCPYFQHSQNSMDYGGWVVSIIYDLPPYNKTAINFWMVKESDNKFSIWIIGGLTSTDAHSIEIVDMKLPMGVTVEYLDGSDIIASSDWSNYISGKVYNSTVSPVAALCNEFISNKKIELTGAITGSVSTDFSSDTRISTDIPYTHIDLNGHIYGGLANGGFKTGVTNYIGAYLNWDNIGEIPIENIPKGAIEKPKYVKDEAEMLTLTIEDVQNGDTVICTDHDPANMYLVVREDLLGTMKAFIQYKGGAATSVAWQNVTGKPDSIVQSINGAKADESGNIELGGRNLVRNSNVVHTSSGTLIYDYELTENVELNQNYTVTIWGELGVGKTGFNAYIGTGYTPITQLTKIRDGVYRGTGLKASWYDEDQASKRNRLQIYAMSSNVSSPSTIKKIKFERGSVSTDWTPAPEDLMSETSTLELATAELYETMLQIKPDLAVGPAMTRLYSSLVQKNEMSISQINPKIRSSVTEMIKMEELKNERTISE